MKSIDIDEFNIKTYLSCIEKCKIGIDAKLKQLNELKRYSNLIGCTNLSNTYTYTGSISDKTGNAAEKKLDLIIEIKRDIVKYTMKKNVIINDIYKLDNNKYIYILLKRYVELKSLEQISVDMCYTYEHIRHLHSKALKNLSNIIIKDHTQSYIEV